MKRLAKLGIGIAAVVAAVIGLKECDWFRTYEIPKGGCETVYDCGRICYNGLLDERWFEASVDGETLPYTVKGDVLQVRGCWLQIVSADGKSLVLKR